MNSRAIAPRESSAPVDATDIDRQASLPIRPRRSWWTVVSVVAAVYLVLALAEFAVVNPGWRWDRVAAYLFSERVLLGVLNTLLVTVLSTVCGLLLGLVAATCRMSGSVLLKTLSYVYIWVSRAVPLLVVVLFVYFLAALTPRLGIGIPFGPSLFSVPTNEVISRFSAAIIALSLYLGGKSAEIFRAGVASVHSGQFEACRSLALSPLDTYRFVVGPQAIRIIIPPLSNEVITMFKNTSLISAIGFAELLTTVQSIYSRTFETIPLLLVAVIWYLTLTSVAMVLQGRLERRFSRGVRVL
jgi:polar amino acid transport system permease protein